MPTHLQLPQVSPFHAGSIVGYPFFARLKGMYGVHVRELRRVQVIHFMCLDASFLHQEHCTCWIGIPKVEMFSRKSGEGVSQDTTWIWCWCKTSIRTEQLIFFRTWFASPPLPSPSILALKKNICVFFSHPFVRNEWGETKNKWEMDHISFLPYVSLFTVIRYHLYYCR